MDEENELKIICPFCNCEYTAEMKRELDVLDDGSCSCGYWSHHEDKVDIICGNCFKVVYSKIIRCEGHLH